MVQTRSKAGVEASIVLGHNISDKKKTEQEWEFGGPIGVTALMIWSHYIVLYFWYCLESNSGAMVIPTSLDSLQHHIGNLGSLLIEKGTPSLTTWVAYILFFAVQLLLASVMPGMMMEGMPTAPHGVRLRYNCNGYSCYYLCIAGFFLVHFAGIFPMTYLADHFGEVLIAAMIIADVTSVCWYVYGLLYADEYNGKDKRTGNVPYDFFMGTILYPRFGEVDIKMISECRWSWLTLMLITLSCAAKQYETRGSVSPNLCFMLLAHWLYSNATVKGEHCIPPTWDMFHENYGWMLNFWNICGVPFIYCFQSVYILRNQDAIDEHYPTALIIADFALLLLGYYIFDSANAQKASVKNPELKRNTFPQVPWGRLQEPIRFIETPKGNLLVDGWYAFVRKIQYTGDIMMALSWGLATGLPLLTLSHNNNNNNSSGSMIGSMSGSSLLNYFYCVFFTAMIVHRQSRDEVRCAAKYGNYWKQYTDQVPNVFLPGADFYRWLFTGKHPANHNNSSSSNSSNNSSSAMKKKAQ